MMRLNRFALVAGILALGVAACGDDVQVVEPTPPAPPPPPPLAASMAPESAEVEVDGSVVFAVNASGGVAGEAASWTCSSSNTGIATASTTSAGCQATGVAAGGVTITASVTKGNETANVGSQLTVTAPAAPPPFEASIAPTSASVAVESSVVFAVNASGGYTGMMMDGMMMGASWTCASSDPAIALVETTEAGCQATGVSGGEVTINVAATDDHTTINLVAQLTVTTDPVDPVQPFSATMSPESAEVAIESSAVFAINTSGGAADATAEWTCSSSDDAIATAMTTDAGCQATGVAAGGVTINAAVTKGDDSASLASQLTVTAPDVAAPAFVLITDVKSDGDAEDGKHAGTVSVTISIDRGGQTLTHLGLAVDGTTIVAQQSFGIAMAAPSEDEAAEQAPAQSLTLSFESDGYNSETGSPAFMNGDHVLQAGLVVAGSDVPIPSNAVPVDFDNPDGVHVNASAPGQSVMNAADGNLWYGGPGSKAFTVEAVPVIFSGGGASSMTIIGGFCGATTATASEAPFEFTLECKSSDDVAGDTPKFTVVSGGQSKTDLKILNLAESIFPIRLDYEAPEAPTFVANPNMRAGGWINGTVDLTGKQVPDEGPKQNLDGWLKYSDKDIDNPASRGVGGYTVQLRYSTTTPSIVDGARTAPASSSPTLPAATEKATDICFIATAVDALGNESKLPDAGTSCVPGADPSNVIQAGVDITAPTIAFSGTSPKANARNLTSEFQLQVEDESKASGLHEKPVLAKIELRNAKDEVICGDDDEDELDLPGNEDIRGNCLNTIDGFDFDEVLGLVTTTGLTPASTTAYYTITAMARDNAGNHSEPVSRVALHDPDGVNGDKNAVSLIGGSYDASKAVYNLIVSVTDDFSIRDYYVALNFPNDEGVLVRAGATDPDDPSLPGRFRVMDPVAVDAYNSALTKTANPSGAYNAILALQTTARSGTGTDTDPYVHSVTDFGTTSTALTSVAIRARDQSEGNKGYSEQTDEADAYAGTGFPVQTALPETQTGAAPEPGGILSFTFEADEDAYDSADAVELTAEVVGYSRDAKAALEIVPAVPAVGTTAAVPAVNAPAVPAIPFKEPFKRVDFYAETADELRFIASVSGATGAKSDNTVDDDDDGVDDVADDDVGAVTDDTDDDTDALSVADERSNTDNEVTFAYEVSVPAADLYAALQDSGKGEYKGRIIAIGVSATASAANRDDLPTVGGVGLVSRPFSVTIEK